MPTIRIAIALVAAVAAVPALAAAPRALPVGPCLNIGNTLEPEQEGAWGGEKVTAEDFRRIRAAGFDTIRLPVRWHNKSQDKPPYAVEPRWMARVVTVVDEALAADLKVILDSHHFDPIHKDPLGTQPWHTAVWGQIATRFQDYPTDRLWFELENEPHDKFDDSNLRAVLDPALAEVRKTNPTRPVIIGGQKWSGIDSLATLTLPDDPNVYPTFHYYDPFDFTHQGAEWVAPNAPPLGRVYGTQADAELLQRDVAKVEAFVARTGLVPLMGESGAFDRHASLAQRVLYTKAVHDAFVPAGVATCQWAYANTFPFYDRKAGRWLPGLRAALGLPDDGATTEAPAASSASSPAKSGALAELQKQLPGTLINDPTRIDWATQGAALKVKPLQDAAIPGGGAARRYTLSHKPANVWEAQTLVPLTAAIAKGQTITIGLYARTLSAKTADGKGVLGVRVQQNSAPYPGFGDASLAIGRDWQWYEVSALADRNIARDLATVVLQLGGAEQEIEIGQAIVIEGAPSIAKASPRPAAASTGAVEELPPPLANAGMLLNRPAARAWSSFGKGGTWQDRDEPAIWLGKATRYATSALGANPWDLGLSVPITEPIKAGDNLLIAIAARTESAATPDRRATIGIRVQGNTPPYDGFADNSFGVGPNWQLVRIKTVATRDLAPGAGEVVLHFAGAVQAVDIGPVYVLKLP